VTERFPFREPSFYRRFEKNLLSIPAVDLAGAHEPADRRGGAESCTRAARRGIAEHLDLGIDRGLDVSLPHTARSFEEDSVPESVTG
jgi:hypothetical protein